jgi:hypothetical protein
VWCPEQDLILHPRGLVADAYYRLRFGSPRSDEERSGAELAAGVRVHLSTAPSHEVVRYTRIPMDGRP